MNFPTDKNNFHIWVLAPFLETDDENLSYYYDYTQSIEEYKKVFLEIGCTWQWENVTMENVQQIMEKIIAQKDKINIAFNLCDGDEINGTPGVSVIHALEKNNIIYTGSSTEFYNITTSKIPMKAAFDKALVPTAAWQVVKNNTSFTKLFLQHPLLIVKPAVSGGSMGLMAKNVVENEEELYSIVTEIQKGYHGWKLDVDGVFVEAFIQGREFTTFIVGSFNDEKSLIFYKPVERVFHTSLPHREKILSFDRLWETYDTEAAMPNDEYVYNYAAVEEKLHNELKKISIDAYKSVAGMGYGRIDIRMDDATGKLYVLEVNAQSGISEDEDYTSIGAILRLSNKTFTQLVIEIINNALTRNQQN